MIDEIISDAAKKDCCQWPRIFVSNIIASSNFLLLYISHGYGWL
jgi:hypothetical protein